MLYFLKFIHGIRSYTGEWKVSSKENKNEFHSSQSVPFNFLFSDQTAQASLFQKVNGYQYLRGKK